MFGYVRPSDQRLTEEERQTFRAAYCGLCHALGRRYGAAGRMILNYDLTFLAMILSEGGSTCEKRCIAHPLRKRERPVLRQREQRTADVQERKIELRVEVVRCERGVNGALNGAQRGLVREQ